MIEAISNLLYHIVLVLYGAALYLIGTGVIAMIILGAISLSKRRGKCSQR